MEFITVIMDSRWPLAGIGLYVFATYAIVTSFNAIADYFERSDESTLHDAPISDVARSADELTNELNTPRLVA